MSHKLKIYDETIIDDHQKLGSKARTNFYKTVFTMR